MALHGPGRQSPSSEIISAMFSLVIDPLSKLLPDLEDWQFFRLYLDFFMGFGVLAGVSFAIFDFETTKAPDCIAI